MIDDANTTMLHAQHVMLQCMLHASPHLCGLQALQAWAQPDGKPAEQGAAVRSANSSPLRVGGGGALCQKQPPCTTTNTCSPRPCALAALPLAFPPLVFFGGM